MSRDSPPGADDPAPPGAVGRADAGTDDTTSDAAADDGADGYGSRGSAGPARAPPNEEFGWRGWVLVGVVVLAFLVVPTAILFLPQAQGVIASLGLTLRDAYLVLPLVPAFLLGATAVWAAVRSRSE